MAVEALLFILFLLGGNTTAHVISSSACQDDPSKYMNGKLTGSWPGAADAR